MKERFVNVCIDISHEKVDRPFQYIIPDELEGKLFPGMQVEVPFGAGNHIRKAFVLGLTEHSEYPVERCKKIAGIVPGGIPLEGERIALAAWMKHRYGSTLIAALKTVLPVKKTVREVLRREVRLAIDREQLTEAIALMEQKHFKARARLLKAFLEVDRIPYGFVTDKLSVNAQTLRAMADKGYIVIESEQEYRNPFSRKQKEIKLNHLTENQQCIVDDFTRDYASGVRGSYLLFGITGSGKTECYMEMIEEVLSQKKQVIMLIPEIALTYQTVLRFYHRFGDRVSVIHSKLSAGEKFDQFERAKKGDIDIMIGPRSALFTPFPNLGLILIDEEHESSYKSDGMPKFHAKDTAQKIAADFHASVVLGSATPSVSSYYEAKSGQMKLYELKERYAGAKLPAVEIVDLREELRRGNRSIFSRKLQDKMRQTIEKKEQIMLFLNRRGFAGFISCRSCGTVLKCPHCDVALTQHRGKRMVCHYCGYETSLPPTCPSCGSKYIGGFRIGTEQVEQKILELFPQAAVLRMDADTTKKKDDYEKILTSFSEGDADILVGTQMIVKGHDFPNVTVVGVLAADLSLAAGDYRAAERTFQLLTQAVGRAGRGKKEGCAVIQTYQPEHYAITCAAKQDYEAFYEEEIAYRRIMGYPPVMHMLAVLLGSEREQEVKQTAERVKELITPMITQERLRVIGPAEASIGKIQDIYRQVIYIRHTEYEKLVMVKDNIEQFMEHIGEKNTVRVIFDFDPVNGY